MDGIEEFGLLLKATTRELDRQINEALRPLGITSSQAEALQVLLMAGSLSLGELGGLLVAEGGHPSRLVNRLVSAGLVQRREAADDRRRIELSCTPAGAELARRVKELKEPFRAHLRERLQDGDLALVIGLLDACLRGTSLADTVRQRRAGVAPSAR